MLIRAASAGSRTAWHLPRPARSDGIVLASDCRLSSAAPAGRMGSHRSAHVGSGAMAGRATLVRAEPGFTLPFFERLAPPPPPALIASRIESDAKPGDAILDLAGRGGWVARAAVDRQRRAVSLESTPLTRLLAELVLRPPDLRHLDAAFQAMGASPRGQTSLKVAVGELFATRCATCGRVLVLDEIVWPDQQAPAVLGGGTARKVYGCPVCRGQRGSDQRTAELDDADLDRAVAAPDDLAGVRARLRDRFPVLDGGVALVDGLLDLHTPRQLGGLDAILDRIETDLRAAPVDAALRLAFLHALTPASRLNGHPHRVGSLRIQAGHVRAPNPGPWRERNPWLAFEDGIRIVRGFIQRLESGPGGAVQARLGNDLQSLDEGSATAVLAIAGPSTTRAIGAEASVNRGGWDGSAAGLRRRIRLVVGQPPVRPNQERLSMTYWATSWTLGGEAAAGLPPGAVPPPAARTRANVALETIPGGAGDPDVVPGVGLFGSAERIDRRPFSAADVSRTVADVAVESLKARGEPASADRLLGEILIGLDRAGQLRRLVAGREAAAVPLADRVEWSVFSLLSTAGPLSETSFLQRIAGIFSAHDLPDEALVRACLQSYRSRASTPERVVTGDDLLRRTQEHAEVIALLADGGHRLGARVWIGRREQARRLGAGRLGDLMDDREHRVPLTQISRAGEDV